MIKALLRKVFGSREEEISKEEINLQELQKWFNNQTKEVMPGLDNKLSQKFSELKEILRELKHATDHLQEASISEDHKIDFKTRQLVLGNRISYIRALRILVSQLNLQYINYQDAIDFSHKAYTTLNEFSKDTQKNYFACQHLFHKQVEPIAKALRQVDEVIALIKTIIVDSKIEAIVELKSRLRGLESTKNLMHNLNKQKDETEDKLNDYKAMKQNKVQQIDFLKKSDESKQLVTLSEQRKKLKVGISNLESEFLTVFSALEHPLRKYSKISLDYRQLIEKYLENPISTLMVDKDKRILIILQGLRKAIEVGALEIKDKKKDKTLRVIQDFNEDYTMRFLFRYQGMLDDRNSIDYKTQQFKVLEKIEQQDKEIKDIGDKITRIEDDLSVIIEKINKIDLKEDFLEIEREILNILSVNIKIV